MSADERYLSAVNDIIGGGLCVDDDGYSHAEALCRVAGALLKTVTLARFNSSSLNNIEPEGSSWEPQSTALSDAELHEALTGIHTLLRRAPVVLDHLRSTGGLRESVERIGFVPGERNAQ